MPDKNIQVKISFSGVVISVQPRSNVWRYRLDNICTERRGKDE